MEWSRQWSLSKLSSAKGVDERKLLHVSINGPSMQLKFFSLQQSEWKKKDVQELLDIGKCRLHTIYHSLKTGTEASGWEIKKTFTAYYMTLLLDTTFAYLLQAQIRSPWYSVQWWIEEKPVADRFFEPWRNLKKSNEVLEKSLQVQTVQKVLEKCFARPSSHSKIGIFQLFCWNV